MNSTELIKGTLTAMILKLLSESGKMYGYEMAQRVRDLSGEKILLRDGSLYPALHKMTEDGLLAFQEEMIGKRVRKYYFLTEKGKQEAVSYLGELKEFMSAINQVVFSQVNTQQA
jgi:PadR family transcriptional regulator, regulatory protein PadR